jgi:hypothetical protein
MCDVGKKIKFCSCLTAEDIDVFEAYKELKHNLKQTISTSMQPLTWTLYKHLGHEASALVGMLKMPSTELLNSLTNEYVLSQINNSNCFDFDYAPSEGDNLKIEQQRNEYSSEFLSFIFRNGKWRADSYYTFTERIEAFNYGKVESK